VAAARFIAFREQRILIEKSLPHFADDAKKVNWRPFAQCLAGAHLKSFESESIAKTDAIDVVFSPFAPVNLCQSRDFRENVGWPI
jgi:hypothetical protein